MSESHHLVFARSLRLDSSRSATTGHDCDAAGGRGPTLHQVTAHQEGEKDSLEG